MKHIVFLTCIGSLALALTALINGKTLLARCDWPLNKSPNQKSNNPNGQNL